MRLVFMQSVLRRFAVAAVSACLVMLVGCGRPALRISIDYAGYDRDLQLQSLRSLEYVEVEVLRVNGDRRECRLPLLIEEGGKSLGPLVTVVTKGLEDSLGIKSLNDGDRLTFAGEVYVRPELKVDQRSEGTGSRTVKTIEIGADSFDGFGCDSAKAAVPEYADKSEYELRKTVWRMNLKRQEFLYSSIRKLKGKVSIKLESENIDQSLCESAPHDYRRPPPDANEPDQ